jgi:uncharacterized protein YyaL (SSP411 family)
LLTPVLGACAAGPAPAPATPGSATAGYPSGAPKSPLVWAELNPATLARAKAERRFIVLDGSAEWCHFCHVMEAETYHDPVVAEILGKSFIAVKVDVDARPDIEERYGAWGWPATVIFSPDAEELGKYRGYIAPEAFAEILRAVVTSTSDAKTSIAGATSGEASLPVPGKGPLPEDEIAWIARDTELALADFYDEDAGGWGRSQKAALAMDNEWAIARARAGAAEARTHVLFTLDAQRRLFDPVWGGIYQYSAASDWEHPHFEKLMTFQAGALDNYADAYALTRDGKWLTCARALRGYIDAFLTSSDGGFYATQDADLNAHEPSKPFVTGHEYYAKTDAQRRALGIPRVDAHEYGKENGLAIAAYTRLYEATGDATALATATRAAKRILATHAVPARGGIAHDADPKATVLHLADNAVFGLALLRLHEATREQTWLDEATKMAAFLERELYDAKGGGFFGSTVDPDAVGVFAERRKPFEDNVVALRFLARLARATRDGRYEPMIATTLRAIASPDAIRERGRMLGDFLLALEETRGVRGPNDARDGK